MYALLTMLLCFIVGIALLAANICIIKSLGRLLLTDTRTLNTVDTTSDQRTSEHSNPIYEHKHINTKIIIQPNEDICLAV